MPEVSVIIPTFNRPELLQRALESLRIQTFRDFEAVVVNDAGVDVGDIVERFQSSFSVHYVTASKNGGLAAARNLALSHAKGSLIAYLDDDDLFLSEHLTTLRTFWHAVPNQVVYTDAYRTSYYREAGGTLKVIKRKVPFSKSYSLETILVENLAPVNCFMHHRDCLQKAGLFDTGLHTHEDWDFWIRMGLNFPFAHLPKVTSDVSFIYGGGSMTATRLMSFERTRLLLFRRYAQHAGTLPEVIDRQRAVEQSIYKRYAPAIDLFDPTHQKEDRVFEFFEAMMKPENKWAAQVSEALCKEYRLARQIPWLPAWKAGYFRFLALFNPKYRYRTIYD